MRTEILSPSDEQVISRLGKIRGVSRKSKIVYVGSSTLDSKEWEIRAEIDAAHELPELVDVDILSSMLQLAKENLGYEKGDEGAIWEAVAIGLLRQKWGPEAEVNSRAHYNLAGSIRITAGEFGKAFNLEETRLERNRGSILLEEGEEYAIKTVCPASGLVKQWARTAQEAFAKLEHS